jgi:signal transduction histidine kinase/ligand-binding sensor domain-containing protein
MTQRRILLVSLWLLAGCLTLASAWASASAFAGPAATAGVAAAATAPSQSDYFLRVWKTDDGLPENSVTAVVQGRDGYLWLATYAGLARFDGVRFTIYNSANTPELQSDRLTSLFQDNQGDLWIGHERGDLTRYHDGKFEAYNIHEAGARRKITAIRQDTAGDIWALNEEGTVIRVRDGASCTLTNDNGVAGMAEDGDGQIWVVSGGKLAPLRNGTLEPLSETNDFVGYYVHGICRSLDGGLWIASDGRIRKRIDHQWVEDIGTNPCTTTITAMVETRSGSVALGAVGSGLYILPAHGLPIHFSHAEDFPDDWIRCLFEDREGTLWVGAGNGGLVAVRQGNVAMFSPPDHWQGRIPLSTAVSRDGSVWVTTEGAGLYRFAQGAWENFGQSAGISNLFDWCVSEDMQGRMWVGSWGNGMFEKQGDRFIHPPGMENINVPMAAILHARNGVTWVGTMNGLIRYDHGAVKWYGEKDGLHVPDVRAIAETGDGTIWCGMLGGGLGQIAHGTVKHFGKTDGLASDYVQGLHVSAAGTLWIGTYDGGMSRFKNGQFARITARDGLPDNSICAIEEDGHSNLWIGSRTGIFRVQEQALNDFADGRTTSVQCQTFGKSEGMASVKCTGGFQPAACKTADGRLWFPTIKGMAVLNPDAPRPVHRPVPVVIESALAEGRPLALPPDGSPVKVPAGWQRFEFHYTGLSFIAPDEIQFQYRLDGWEKEWNNAGTKRAAEYNYLPPGNYRFRVRACNRDGVWDENDASFAFTVAPHFWQTWWFYSLMSLLALAGVASVVWQVSRRRLRRRLEDAERQQSLERERTRIAKDIHDHLGANLTRISLLSQAAHGELENPSQAGKQLERIYDTSRELTRSMDEIVWAVNPQHDTLDSMASYLGNFAQDYLGSLGTRCRLEVPLQLPHWPISAEMRHNVFLAFKEALHNIVKHSGAQEVTVYLDLKPSGFSLIVRDNGRGFDPASVPKRPGRGNGLKNMRQRMEKLGGHCEIQSTPGAGTEIRFSVLTGAPPG